MAGMHPDDLDLAILQVISTYSSPDRATHRSTGVAIDTSTSLPAHPTGVSDMDHLDKLVTARLRSWGLTIRHNTLWNVSLQRAIDRLVTLNSIIIAADGSYQLGPTAAMTLARATLYADRPASAWLLQMSERARPRHRVLSETQTESSTEDLNLLERLTGMEAAEWQLPRYRGVVRPGDSVYFWKAGRAAGLYGVGQIERLSRGRNDSGPLIATVVHQHIALAPLRRQDVQNDPQLAHLAVLRQPRGSIFPVTSAEGQALDRWLNLSTSLTVMIARKPQQNNRHERSNDKTPGKHAGQTGANGQHIYQVMQVHSAEALQRWNALGVLLSARTDQSNPYPAGIRYWLLEQDADTPTQARLVERGLVEDVEVVEQRDDVGSLEGEAEIRLRAQIEEQTHQLIALESLPTLLGATAATIIIAALTSNTGADVVAYTSIEIPNNGTVADVLSHRPHQQPAQVNEKSTSYGTTAYGMTVPSPALHASGAGLSTEPLSTVWHHPALTAMRGNLVVPDALLMQLDTLLEAGGHLLITGAPGTGKTTLAQTVAQAHAALHLSTPPMTVTATADWTTYDTIGGYMPSATAAGRLEFREGVVLRAIRQHAWLVVDELNRADADKAFGPLLTVLSGFAVELPFHDDQGRPFRIVPPSTHMSVAGFDPATATYTIGQHWRLIGTMNTADRQALFALSAALRRRFATIHLSAPSAQTLDLILIQAGYTEQIREPVVKLFGMLPLPLGAAILLRVADYVARRLPLASTATSTETIRRTSALSAALGEAIMAFVMTHLDGASSAELLRFVQNCRSLLLPGDLTPLYNYVRELDPTLVLTNARPLRRRLTTTDEESSEP